MYYFVNIEHRCFIANNMIVFTASYCLVFYEYNVLLKCNGMQLC